MKSKYIFAWILSFALFASILGAVHASPTGEEDDYLDEIFRELGIPRTKDADKKPEVTLEQAEEALRRHRQEIQEIIGEKGRDMIAFDQEKRQWFIDLIVINGDIDETTIPSAYEGVMVKYCKAKLPELRADFPQGYEYVRPGVYKDIGK